VDAIDSARQLLARYGQNDSEMAITRKNALFAGNDSGGRHWAISATLVQSAKLNGVKPLAWLTDVLERIVSGRTKRHELETLLPWNWKAAREAEAAETG
jgi:transposase